MPGKGRPFEKGNKASPGRPKSNLTRLLGEFLEKKCPGDVQKRSYEQLLVERLVTKAIKDGDQDLFEFIWARREGKIPMAESDLMEIGGNITVKVVNYGNKETVK